VSWNVFLRRASFALSIVLFGVAGVLIGIRLHGRGAFSSSSVLSQASQDESEKEQQIPFAEMTIPSLRNRAYDSSLTILRQYQRQRRYSSYIAHYDSEVARVQALLTIPSGAQPEGGWPAIVFVHGYIPPSQYRTTQRYISHVNALAQKGFVVLKIDLRGHGESEGTASGAYYSEEYIEDVLNARAALQNFSEVNPQRIGLWGHSMAGNVVLRAMVARPEIPAGVIWAGAVFDYEDFQELGLSDNSYRPPEIMDERRKRREALFSAHGQFQKESSFWRTVAPVNYLQDLQGVIQLHHPTKDAVVSVEYSRRLWKRLRPLSPRHEFYEYAIGDHNFSGPAYSTAMSRTIAFFEQYLVP